MKKMFLMSLFLCLVLVLSACGGDQEGEPEESLTETLINPLNGSELVVMPTRLFAVAIDNGPNAEPQSGLNDAELLIEVPVEGGITRFLAFFYHEMPEKIGPVRSARHYVIPLAQGMQAIYIHCGQSPLAKQYFEDYDVEHINEFFHSAAFWRDDSRKAPVNLYTSYEKLVQEVTNEGWYDEVAVPAFSFYSTEEVAAMALGEVTEIHIPYVYKAVDYQWDGEQYLRQSDGKPHIDAESGETRVCR